jgi:hypothetical protein
MLVRTVPMALDATTRYQMEPPNGNVTLYEAFTALFPPPID